MVEHKELIDWLEKQKSNSSVICVPNDTSDKEIQKLWRLLKKLKSVIGVKREEEVEECWWFKDG